MQTHICTQYENRALQTLEGLCIEAIFSSLFQPQFRTHEPGWKIADAASGHCHNLTLGHLARTKYSEGICVHTTCETAFWPRHLAADEPHEHSESNSKVALASTVEALCPRQRFRALFNPPKPALDLGGCCHLELIHISNFSTLASCS